MSRRFSEGAFTLIELMIAMTLLAILCTAVISAYLFMGRNLERMMNTQKQNLHARRALQQFSADVGSAVAFTSATTSNLTFTTATSGTLTNCTLTSGSTTVTCASTAILVAGMTVSCTNYLPSSATVSSVTNGTTFVLSTAAIQTGAGQSIAASGGGPTVTYLYNSGSSPATLTRTASGVTTTLLTNIDTTVTSPANGFAFYDENGNSVSGTSSYVKAIEFTFTTTEGSSIAGTKSRYLVVSPRVTLRNKPVLK